MGEICKLPEFSILVKDKLGCEVSQPSFTGPQTCEGTLFFENDSGSLREPWSTNFLVEESAKHNSDF